MDLKQTELDEVDQVKLAQVTVNFQALVNTAMNFRVLDYRKNSSSLKKELVPCIIIIAYFVSGN